MQSWINARCMRNSQRAKYYLDQYFPFGMAPLKVWELESVGPIPGPPNTNKNYIITIIDYTARWLVVKATKHHTGNKIQRHIEKQIIAKLGITQLLFTDVGKVLTSNKANIYLADKGIDHRNHAIPSTSKWKSQKTQRIPVKSYFKTHSQWSLQLTQEAPDCTDVFPRTSKPQHRTHSYKMVLGKKTTINTNAPEPKPKISKNVPLLSTPSIKRIIKSSPLKRQNVPKTACH